MFIEHRLPLWYASVNEYLQELAKIFSLAAGLLLGLAETLKSDGTVADDKATDLIASLAY